LKILLFGWYINNNNPLIQSSEKEGLDDDVNDIGNDGKY
jgi:hypothetical protein